MDETTNNNEVVEENTEATQQNTVATLRGSDLSNNSMKVELVRAATVIIAVLATVFISTRSAAFSENQAGLILSGVVGGYFGLASQRK